MHIYNNLLLSFFLLYIVLNAHSNGTTDNNCAHTSTIIKISVSVSCILVMLSIWFCLCYLRSQILLSSKRNFRSESITGTKIQRWLIFQMTICVQLLRFCYIEIIIVTQTFPYIEFNMVTELSWRYSLWILPFIQLWQYNDSSYWFCFSCCFWN